MACRSFLLAKHDAIPDLNSNYILFHETKMDLSDTSEFLLVIQVLRCLRGYNPPIFWCFFARLNLCKTILIVEIEPFVKLLLFLCQVVKMDTKRQLKEKHGDGV